MQTKKDILNILEKERSRFVSGQELADSLNISRTAVWKAIKTLEEDGHRIQAVTNRGYKLDDSSDLLTEEGIRAALPEKYQGCPIVVMKTADSTNTQAKRLSLEKAVHGTMVLAEEQTAGRGRSGKSFFSPRDAGLYMSVILKQAMEVSEAHLITVAAAVAVCRAVEKLTALEPRIKWVNDIYLDGKKICGILTEAVTDFESGGIESIVVGTGVNCTTTEAMLPEELRGIAGSLRVEGVSRNRLAAEIATGILDSFARLGDREIIEEYRKRSLMFGREISFLRCGETVFADVTGINDLGNLLVRLKTGEDIVLNSGEVSLGHLQYGDTSMKLNTKEMVLCALFTALIAAGAFIKIPIPYVPITLQFLFTNLAGLLLGRRKGLISVGLYIILGLAGMPIFTQGGGLSYVYQPTFGYILGFALGTWLAGLIVERGNGDTKTCILAGFANFVAVFALGLAYFYLISNYYLAEPIGMEKLIVTGFLLCAPGDVAWVILSAILAQRLRPITIKGISGT